MAEQFTGKLSSATFTKKNDKGWSNYDLVFENGQSYAGVGVAPDNNVKIEAGATLSLFKTKYSWMVAKPEENKPKEEGGKPSTANGSGSYTARNDAWNQYQMEQRDPKIERQTYIRMALDFYAAALPYMEVKPKNSKEIDALFDDAVTKGDAEYQRANK